MNATHIIKSLNMTCGETLTLEKAKDRMEFEALPILDTNKGICSTVNFCYCPSECEGYFNCRPFK